ncbi:MULTISPECIES: non-ribosomal peptide synthetase [unclassified Phaeobacter]|uniref:non-ribosomal peptide synthetase n=1 Tax=unclassified Phaeobacter TaxID=2621772 RepID=UPI00237F85C6|nr:MULTISPECIES: non-ribosomal peptide synthetase [unclassified Phaeobacter]MDE4136965.1 non-ribosomal peptide synthetase [Phaeobacter sp. QD34_24]
MMQSDRLHSWFAARGAAPSCLKARVAKAISPERLCQTIRGLADFGADLRVDLQAEARGVRVSLEAPAARADPASLLLLLKAACEGQTAWPAEVPSHEDYLAWQQSLLGDGRAEEGQRHWQAVLQDRLVAPPKVLRATPVLALSNTPGEAEVLSAWRAVLDRSFDAAPDLAVLCDPRDDPGLAGAIGPFALPLPLSWVPKPGQSAAARSAAAAEALALTRAHQSTYVPPESGASPGTAGLLWHRLQAVPGIEVLEASAPALATGCDLELFEAEARLHMRLLFDPERLQDQQAAWMLERLQTWITAQQAPDLRPVLGSSEFAWQRRHLDGPPLEEQFQPLFDRLSALAAAAPDALAISGPQTESLAALLVQADGLAGALIRAGAGPGARVGVALGMGRDWLCAVLAILRSGAAFVPLPPDLPARRRQMMAEDVGISLLVSDGSGEGIIAGIAMIPLTARAERPTDAPSPHSADLAYVIFTSGSTGRPKGVCISHGAFDHYLHWARSAYRLSTEASSPVHARTEADMGLTSLFVPLLQGKALRFLPPDPPGAALVDALTGAGDLGLVKLTPSLLAAVPSSEGEGPRLGCLILGGEALRAEQLRPWLGVARIVNEYGPTEATVGCVAHEVPAAAPLPDLIPIGRPIAGARLYVLDDRVCPVPQGKAGELFIAGPMLAEGYHARPGDTACAFVPNPFSEMPGERMYRTGDLVRLDLDGVLHYLGRRDDEVKIRGHRLHPAEVEQALEQHAAVRAAAVVPAPDRQSLAACVVLDQPLRPRALQRHLAERLPEALIPAPILPVEQLPLGASGKVDRRAIAALAFPEPAAPAEVPGDLDPKVAEVIAIFSDLLGGVAVGPSDNFFELGGHSLLAIRMVAALRKSGFPDLLVRDFFDHPTPAGLVAAVGLSQGVPREEGVL